MQSFMLKESYRILTERRQSVRDQVKHSGKVVRQAMESGGGVHDNAMHEAAVHEQRVLAARLERLEQLLASPLFVEEIETAEGVVTIGKVVTVRREGGAYETYSILGPADIEAGFLPNAVSYLSPLGQSLLGNAAGDRIEIDVPSGRYIVELTAVKKIGGRGPG